MSFNPEAYFRRAVSWDGISKSPNNINSLRDSYLAVKNANEIRVYDRNGNIDLTLKLAILGEKMKKLPRLNGVEYELDKGSVSILMKYQGKEYRA